MPIERHYSPTTLAKLFDLSSDFWRKRIRSGEIKAIRLGGAVRIPEREVRRLMEAIETETDIIE